VFWGRGGGQKRTTPTAPLRRSGLIQIAACRSHRHGRSLSPPPRRCGRPGGDGRALCRSTPPVGPRPSVLGHEPDWGTNRGCRGLAVAREGGAATDVPAESDSWRGEPGFQPVRNPSRCNHRWTLHGGCPSRKAAGSPHFQGGQSYHHLRRWTSGPRACGLCRMCAVGILHPCGPMRVGDLRCFFPCARGEPSRWRNARGSGRAVAWSSGLSGGSSVLSCGTLTGRGPRRTCSCSGARSTGWMMVRRTTS
jgi:hypothetical protein